MPPTADKCFLIRRKA